MINKKLIFGLVFILLLSFGSASAALTDNLISYWAFDGDATDSHASNDGTATGATNGLPYGKINEGYKFTRPSDDINVPHNDDFNLIADYSFSFWINSSTADTTYVIGKRSAGHTAKPFNLMLQGSTHKFFMYIGDGTTQTSVTSDNAIGTGVLTHVVVTVNGTQVKFYYSGVQSGATETISLANQAGGTDDLDIINHDGNGAGLTGTFDEVAVWNRTITPDEVSELYNSGSGFAYPFSSSSVTNYFPSNNSHEANTTIYFNANVTGYNSTSCELKHNGVGVSNATATTTNVIFPNSTMTDGSYQWNVQCGTTSSANYTLIYDSTNPVYTEYLLQTDNSTIYPYTNVSTIKNFSGKVTDTYVFAWLTNITNSTGGVMFTNTTTNLTGTVEWINHSLDINGWDTGVYTQTITASDDHTVNWIPDDWNITQGTNSVTFTTDTNTITLESSVGNLKGVTTSYHTDRYSFTFEKQNAVTEWGFDLTCDDELYYRGNLYPYPVFVCGSNWVDFNTNTPDITYNVNKLPTGGYNINIKSLSSNKQIEFKSIGGLNIITDIITFQITEEPLAPLQPTIYGQCVDIVLNSTNQLITLNMSLTSDPNGDPFTHNIGVKNILLPYYFINNLPQNTQVQSFNVTNTDIPNGNYTFIVNSTDDTNLSNITVSSCSFDVCVSSWTSSVGLCSVNGTQLKTYTDSNSCSLVYDRPADHNTLVSCTPTVEEDRAVLVILLVLIIGMFILWIVTKNFIMGAVITFFLILTTVYINSVFNEPIIMVGLLFITLMSLLITIVSIRDKS